MRCPGQDRRYWTEDAVFEVPCPECGESVEFFKDESSGRCTHCGHRFRNPGMDFGCASWCSVAAQCLGFVSEDGLAPQAKQGALAGRLIQQIGEAFKDDAARVMRALKTYHHAKELVAKEGGAPRATLAAALLLETCRSAGDGAEAATAEEPLQAEQLLRHADADDETIAHVTRILRRYRAGEEPDSIEARIVHDADRLARLTAEGASDEHADAEAVIETELLTEAGRQAARSWYDHDQRGAKP